ncbi:glycoside hydrolase family 24 protein [Acinetobacter courvalinii]|uniref:glycoside hydrolase family 24 protein n=1 Tax=Acinetobacter courvalinii TaxID=280147 RepID=UPI0021CD1E71|nr:glycoside hydrolase family 104 protein [Acinetobacter courvalinii]
MAKQYESLLNNPNVRSMLNLIAKAEGVKWGYNTLFGNQKIDSLAAHPNIRKEFTQTDGRKNYTTAAGRYQFLKGTWDGLAKQYGLSDFSPRSQDLGAIALLAQNGALPYVLKGDYQTAVKKSGTTWASLPSSTYAQGKRSWDFVNKQLGVQPSQQNNRFKSIQDFQHAVSALNNTPKETSGRYKTLEDFQKEIAKIEQPLPQEQPRQRFKTFEDFQNAIQLLGEQNG